MNVAEDQTVPMAEFIAVLRMLVRRANDVDRALAAERPLHWLNKALEAISQWDAL